MMTTNNNFLAPSVDADDVQPLNYDTLPRDLAEQLQRYEQDALRYLGDAQQSIYALAKTLKGANDLLAKGRTGTYEAWVQRLYPAISLRTARRLVQIADQLADDNRPQGPIIPSNLINISAIVAYLSAPEEVQEKVREGEVPPQRNQITEATLLAQKAQQRAAELELQLSKATRELNELEGVRQSAERTLKGALLEAENANLKLNNMQDTIEERVRAATLAGRAELEEQYRAEIAEAYATLEAERKKTAANLKLADEKVKKLDKQREESEQIAHNLAEQLKRAGDDGAKWARWEVSYNRFEKQIEAIAAELPPESDMAVWLPAHWELLKSLQKRVERLNNLLLERQRLYETRGYVVDSKASH